MTKQAHQDSRQGTVLAEQDVGACGETGRRTGGVTTRQRALTSAIGGAVALGGALSIARVLVAVPYAHPPHGMRLTPRDLEIVRWIGRHGLTTAQQVEQRFFHGPRAAYRRLQVLIRSGLLRRDPTFWREPAVVRVTPAGARLVALPLAPAEVVLPEVRHSLALVTLSERLLAAYPGATFVTERELRAAELRTRRRDPTHRGYERMPDGLLLPPTGQRLAIELDLTSKRTGDLERIITAYQNMAVFLDPARAITHVLWFARAPEAARLRTCVTVLSCTDLISVAEWQP